MLASDAKNGVTHHGDFWGIAYNCPFTGYSALIAVLIVSVNGDPPEVSQPRILVFSQLTLLCNANGRDRLLPYPAFLWGTMPLASMKCWRIVLIVKPALNAHAVVRFLSHRFRLLSHR